MLSYLDKSEPYIHPNSYRVCKKTKLPKTKTVEYEIKWPSRLESDIISEDIDWDNPVFGEDDPPDDLISAYAMACTGDSGAPDMFLTDGLNLRTYPNAIPAKEPKFVLYSIVSSNRGLYRSKKTNQYEDLPCGSYLYDTEGQEFVSSIAISHKITDPQIFKWIKDTIAKH